MISRHRPNEGTAPDVGVVIPLFNQKEVIERAISSVLGQTYKDFSLYVVDDGSTDGGADRVAGLGDQRIHLLRQANQGPGAARNAGIRACSTTWVGLLDADDEWMPDFLECTLEAARQNTGISAVFTHVSIAGKPAQAHEFQEGELTDYYSARLRHRVSLSSSSVLLRRDHFLAQGGFAEQSRYAEDNEAWFRLVCSGRTYFIPAAQSKIHLDTPGSLTKTVSAADRVHGLEHVLATYERYRREGRIPADLRRSCRLFMENQRACLAGHLINSGRRKEGLIWLITRVRPGKYNWRIYLNCILRAFAPQRGGGNRGKTLSKRT